MPSMTEATPVTTSMTAPMILADGIRKRFGANEVLKGVSLARWLRLRSPSNASPRP